MFRCDGVDLANVQRRKRALVGPCHDGIQQALQFDAHGIKQANIAAGDFAWMAEVAALLKAHLGEGAASGGAPRRAPAVLAVPVFGYGFAWVGHFFFEKNRPATFTYPLYSLIGDFAMFRDILLGKISL